ITVQSSSWSVIDYANTIYFIAYPFLPSEPPPRCLPEWRRGGGCDAWVARSDRGGVASCGHGGCAEGRRTHVRFSFVDGGRQAYSWRAAVRCAAQRRFLRLVARAAGALRAVAVAVRRWATRERALRQRRR